MTDLERDAIQFAEKAIQRARTAVFDVAEDHPAIALLEAAHDAVVRRAYGYAEASARSWSRAGVWPFRVNRIGPDPAPQPPMMARPRGPRPTEHIGSHGAS